MGLIQNPTWKMGQKVCHLMFIEITGRNAQKRDLFFFFFFYYCNCYYFPKVLTITLPNNVRFSTITLIHIFRKNIFSTVPILMPQFNFFLFLLYICLNHLSFNIHRYWLWTLHPSSSEVSELPLKHYPPAPYNFIKVCRLLFSKVLNLSWIYYFLL